jgi:hypothetical protein
MSPKKRVGRPPSEEPMVAVGISIPKKLQEAMEREQALNGHTSFSGFARPILEEGWETYLRLGHRKFFESRAERRSNRRAESA